MSSVHPRVCGEQRPMGPVMHSPCGSSPRVRGTVHRRTPNLPDLRFIPACAGNRILSSSVSARRPVHPRVCGEQPCGTSPCSPGRGSSPRVRGTASECEISDHCTRFIPACAGNRLATGSTSSIDIGSSPRVRGTANFLEAGDRHHRFIPACAGNRSSGACAVRPVTVHPRVCGEQLSGLRTAHPYTGSSPRVRGTVV